MHKFIIFPTVGEIMSRCIRSFVAIFAAFWVCAAVAGQTAPAPVAGLSTKSTTTILIDVHVGVYVTQLGDPDLKNGEFKSVFWLWFRWTGAANFDPLKKFEVINGKIESLDNEYSRHVGDQHYVTAKVRATTSQDFDISRFPLDEHVLNLSIEETSEGIAAIRFVADTANSRMQDGITMAGWLIGQPSITSKSKTYATNFGDPSLSSDTRSEYAQFTFSIPVSRPGISYPFKLFWSLYLAVFVALLAFHIRPIDLDPRFGLGVGAVFAAMASAYVINSCLPDSNQATIADKVVMCSIGFIVMSIIESIISLRLYQAGKVRASARLDLGMFFMFLVTFALTNAYLFSP